MYAVTFSTAHNREQKKKQNYSFDNNKKEIVANIDPNKKHTIHNLTISPKVIMFAPNIFNSN
jgi:hypothetical protein